MKVLGTVALIDEGETDWKILCIDVNDPLAKEMNGKIAFCDSFSVTSSWNTFRASAFPILCKT